MKLYKILAILIATSFLSSAFAKSYIDDRAKFLAEEDRSSYMLISEELDRKTGFSLYLYTDSKEDKFPETSAKLICDTLKGSLKALIYIDLYGNHRAVALSDSAKKMLSESLVERLAQKTLLPEFRKDNYTKGILLFEAEIAKSVARINDVRLNVRMPRAENNSVPDSAWVLIAVVFVFIIITFAYFSKQSIKARHRNKIKEFGGFPHKKFDSGFGI